jgi:thiol:disulfide interchange protein
MFEVGESLTQLASVAEGKKGLSESFWSGVVATIAATPCTAPFMAGAVGFAVLQPPPVALAIFTVLGLGIAFPYLLLCGFPKTRAWLPRPGAWMESFKQLMGFPMLLAMVWFVYILANLLSPEGLALGLASLVFVSLAAWIYGRWAYNPEGSVRGKGKFAAALIAVLGLGTGMYIVAHPEFQAGGPVNSGPPRADELAWVNFSPDEVEKLRAAGKPVFIDFTAAWCVNCKANEKLVLDRKDVVEAFKSKGVITMKADWTRRDATITKALSEFGRTGVPFYVLYPRSGEPIVLPEVLTPQVVQDAIARS